MKAKTMTLISMTAAVLVLAAAPVRAQYTYNRALQLDGNGDYIEVSPEPTISTTLVVEAWIKTSVTTGDQAIISRYNNNSGSNLDDSFQLSVHNGRARFQINPGNTYIILDGARIVADGQWHHILGAYCSQYPGMVLEVDGSWDASNSGVSGTLNNPSSYTKLRIGAAYDNGNAGYFFHGLIDEVRLWNNLGGYYNNDQNRFIPLRDRSGAYPLWGAWRFNVWPEDTGLNASFRGNAVEVSAPDMPLSSQSWANNSYITLDGIGEYINILNQGSSLTPAASLTIEARVRTLSSGGTLQSVVSKYRHNSNSDTDDAYFLGIEPTGVARFQISIGTNYHLLQGTTNLLDGDGLAGKWHHLAGVFDGKQLRLYVDGRLEASGPLTGSLPSNSTPLYIGASQEGTTGVVSDYFNGFLEDVRIWDVALSQAAIQNISTLYPYLGGLVAHWRFEGDFINLVNYKGFPKYWGFPAGTQENMTFCQGSCGHRFL